MAIEPVAAGMDPAAMQNPNGGGNVDQAGNNPETAEAENIEQAARDENVGNNVDVVA